MGVLSQARRGPALQDKGSWPGTAKPDTRGTPRFHPDSGTPSLWDPESATVPYLWQEGAGHRDPEAPLAGIPIIFSAFSTALCSPRPPSPAACQLPTPQVSPTKQTPGWPVRDRIRLPLLHHLFQDLKFGYCFFFSLSFDTLFGGERAA